jgi:hypothetical protein
MTITKSDRNAKSIVFEIIIYSPIVISEPSGNESEYDNFENEMNRLLVNHEERERQIMLAELEFCRANAQEYEQRVQAERDAERACFSADENAQSFDENSDVYDFYYQVVDENSVWRRQGAISMLEGTALENASGQDYENEDLEDLIDHLTSDRYEEHMRQIELAEQEFFRVNAQEYEQRLQAENDAERDWLSANRNDLPVDEIRELYDIYRDLTGVIFLWGRTNAIRMVEGSENENEDFEEEYEDFEDEMERLTIGRWEDFVCEE